ncbi:hypothetical protein [uncultured Croceitalea sp.]|uniref:hypothetical protein n=1 Tax=uncultured Croceitalea sp. TaxID=1798908 RepID=UPI0033064C37
MLFLLLLPLLGVAQLSETVNVQFYEEMAKRDAWHEQHLNLTTDEDREDFWKDQDDFETLLAQKNPKAYHIYLNTKGRLYSQHQSICNDSCQHSGHYAQKTAYYQAHAQESSNFVYSAKTKKPRVKD